MASFNRFLSSFSSNSVSFGSSFAGIHNYGPVHVNQINGAGVVTLNGTQVEQSVRVSGTFESTKARIQDQLVVTGPADLKSTIVEGKTNITGYIKACQSFFNDRITITSEMTRFNECKVNADIEIKSTDDLDQIQKIYLDNTIVTGSIVFKRNRGEVYLNEGSQVLGEIIGGVQKS